MRDGCQVDVAECSDLTSKFFCLWFPDERIPGRPIMNIKFLIAWGFLLACGVLRGESVHAAARRLLEGDTEFLRTFSGWDWPLQEQLLERLLEGVHPADLPPEVPRWLEQLGAEEYALRKEATARLKALGSAVYVELRDFRDARRADPEILYRGNLLLSFTHPRIRFDATDTETIFHLVRILSRMEKIRPEMMRAFEPVYSTFLTAEDAEPRLQRLAAELGQDSVFRFSRQALESEPLRPLLREMMQRPGMEPLRLGYLDAVLRQALSVDAPFAVQGMHGFERQLHAMLSTENRGRVTPAQWASLRDNLPLWSPGAQALGKLEPFFPLPAFFDDWLAKLPPSFHALRLMSWPELASEKAEERRALLNAFAKSGPRRDWMSMFQDKSLEAEEAWFWLRFYAMFHPPYRVEPNNPFDAWLSTAPRAPFARHLFELLAPLSDEDLLERLAEPSEHLHLTGLIAVNRPRLADRLLLRLSASLESDFSAEHAATLGEMLRDYGLQAPPASEALNQSWRTWVQNDAREALPELPNPPAANQLLNPFDETYSLQSLAYHRRLLLCPFRNAERLGIPPSLLFKELSLLDLPDFFQGNATGLARILEHLLRAGDPETRRATLLFLPHASLDAAQGAHPSMFRNSNANFPGLLEEIWTTVLRLDPQLMEDLALHQARALRNLNAILPDRNLLWSSMLFRIPPTEHYTNWRVYFDTHADTLRHMAADPGTLRDLAPLAALLATHPGLREREGDFFRSVFNRVEVQEDEPLATRFSLAAAALLLRAEPRPEWGLALAQGLGVRGGGSGHVLTPHLNEMHAPWIPVLLSENRVEPLEFAIRIDPDHPAVRARVHELLHENEDFRLIGPVLMALKNSGQTVRVADFAPERFRAFLEVARRPPPTKVQNDLFGESFVDDPSFDHQHSGF